LRIIHKDVDILVHHALGLRHVLQYRKQLRIYHILDVLGSVRVEVVLVELPRKLLLSKFVISIGVLVKCGLAFVLQLSAFLLVDEDAGVKELALVGEGVARVLELLLALEGVDDLQLLLLHFRRARGAPVRRHHVVHLLHLLVFLVGVQAVPSERNRQLVR